MKSNWYSERGCRRLYDHFRFTMLEIIFCCRQNATGVVCQIADNPVFASVSVL
jgi:hypothetical protein